jgi:hypothetical protein
MKRKQFLQQSALGIFSTLSHQKTLLPEFQTNLKGKRFFIGACDWSISNTSNLGAMEMAKEIGLDGVQLSLGLKANNMHLRRKDVQEAYKKANNIADGENLSLFKIANDEQSVKDLYNFVMPYVVKDIMAPKEDYATQSFAPPPRTRVNVSYGGGDDAITEASKLTGPDTANFPTLAVIDPANPKVKPMDEEFVYDAGNGLQKGYVYNPTPIAANLPLLAPIAVPADKVRYPLGYTIKDGDTKVSGVSILPVYATGTSLLHTNTLDGQPIKTTIERAGEPAEARSVADVLKADTTNSKTLPQIRFKAVANLSTTLSRKNKTLDNQLVI